MDLTSTPAGAAVYLSMTQTAGGEGDGNKWGAAVGTTPLKLPLPVGQAKITVKKDGYTDYTTNLVVSGKLLAVSNPVSSTAASSKSDTVTAATQPNNAPAPALSSSAVPSYRLEAPLWPAQAAVRHLVPPIPNSQLEYARFLKSNARYLELTVLPDNASGADTAAAGGIEGVPTNLWLYDTTNDSAAQPLLLSYAALNSVANYYGLHLIKKLQPNYTTSTTSSSNSNPGSPNGLAQLAVIDPTLSPDALRLAFVSHSLYKPASSSQSAAGSSGSSQANEPNNPY